MTWDINLQNPRWLAVVLERYLSMGVVPAEGAPPPMLADGVVRLLLPDGSVFETKGRVIRASGPNEFLLQADRLPDLDSLRKMTKVSKYSAAPAGAAGTDAGVPSSTTLVDDLLSTVSPENLLFREVLAPVVQAPPAPQPQRDPKSEPRIERIPTLPPARPETPAGGIPASAKASPSGSHSVFDLLEGSIETAKVEAEVFMAEFQSSTRPSPVAKGSPPSQPEKPVSSVRMPIFRAGTPGSVKDPVERRDKDAAGEPGGAPAVTGRETEYSDVYARVKDLPLVEKQRLARHGRRTIRQILMRDSNKGLQRLVLSNPDILLDEVLEYANWPGLAKDALDYISTNSTWTSSRMVILALVKNPSSPIEMAIRLVPRLGPSEWRLLVRPNVVRTPVAIAALRALENTRE